MRARQRTVEGVRRGAEPGSTRARIIAATVETLRDEGFAATSARSIARHGAFNQALIFYHFGSVVDLLVTTLEAVGSERLREYRAALDGVSDMRTAVEVARRHYADDVRAGHINVLAELIAGASSLPLLGPELVRCMEPWIAFADETIGRFLRGTPLEAIVPTRDAAIALLAIYVGMELLDHLDPEARIAEPLFGVAAGLVDAVAPLLGAGRSSADRSRPRRPRPVVIDGPPSEDKGR